MKRRQFIKRGALFVPMIFIPNLIRAQGYTLRNPSFVGKIATPEVSGGGGSISLVQSTGAIFNDYASTHTGQITGVTAGNLIVLTVALSASDMTAVPTSSGWSVAENPSGHTGGGGYNPVVGIFYKAAAASGTHTFSFSTSTGAYSTCCISEWSSTNATPLDAHANNGVNTTGTSGNSGTTGSTAQAVEVALCVICPDNGSNVNTLSTPAASGWTSLAAVTTEEGTHNCSDHSYKILASTGTQVGSWTWVNNAGYTAAIATFKN